MKIKLQNILKVESADIELGGLTVITGGNDSGKSSIGKILFTMLKAANNVKLVNREKTIQIIEHQLAFIRTMFPHENEMLSKERIALISADLIDNAILFDSLVEAIKQEAVKCEFSTRKMSILGKRITAIHQAIQELKNPEWAVKRSFEGIAKSEFRESLNSYGTKHSVAFFHDDTTDADGSNITLIFENGDLSDIRLWGNISIDDVTYIESPVYLHILDTLRMGNRMLNDIYPDRPKSDVPYHLSDMADKIVATSDRYPNLFEQLDEFQPQLDEISALIEGDITVDKSSKQVYFKRQGISIPIVSVASGIKSFGMLMQLIKTGNISDTKMLVVDEPEIHLHPEWQVRLCKLIVDLVAQGVPIVVSSHSPYFIQGLRYYAAAKGIEKDVVYYMAEQNPKNGLSNFKDVTNNLNEVFALLAAPLQDIMNVDAVRNKKA